MRRTRRHAATDRFAHGEACPCAISLRSWPPSLTHAFLAEYDRTVTIEIDGRPAARKTLFPDSGGYSRTNLYRLDAQHALLRDADASYTIDLASGAISKDDQRRKAGMFIGGFDIDTSKSWTFIPSSEREELEPLPLRSLN